MIRKLISALVVAGFAIPVSQAGAAQPEPQPNTAPKVFSYTAPGRSYLGVDIRDITQDRVAPLKLKEERGVEVTMVDQDAPAGKAGLKEHDVILDFNGAGVESEEQLRRLIRETPPGRTVTLGISRDGNPMKINVQLAEHSKVIAGTHIIQVPPLGAMPDMPDMGNRFDIPGNIYVLRNASSVLGLQTENLTKQLGEFFGVKNGEGVLVRSVEKGSPAEKAGLKAGDVLVRAGDERLSDRSDLARVMRSHRSGKLNLGIVRDKHEQTFTLEIPDRGSRDSSSLYFDSDEVESLLGEAVDVDSELVAANALESARELSNMDLSRQLEKGLSEYNKAMRMYDGETKGLHKQMEELDHLLRMQDEIKLNFHDML